MKTFIALPLVLASVSPAAFADETRPGAIEIDCAHISLPAQQDYARIAGIDNFSQLYVVRNRAMIRVQRSCQQGAQTLLLVFEPAAPDPRQRVALVQRH
jgi:hypothetical protein